MVSMTTDKHMKLANPLYYPLPVLASAIALVLGVRLVKLPSVIVLSLSAVVATSLASWRKSQEPETLNLDNPELERELQSVRQQARLVAQKANDLRSEAAKLLTSSVQMELLVAVQYTCDRAAELPAKIDQMARRLQGSDSLLSVSELQQQLVEVQSKLRSSSGVAKQHLSQLAESLKRNIQLAQQGQDTRTAQIVSFSRIIQDSAGVLQQLQNKLRTSDLSESEQLRELQLLSAELSSLQENVDFLVSK